MTDYLRVVNNTLSKTDIYKKVSIYMISILNFVKIDSYTVSKYAHVFSRYSVRLQTKHYLNTFGFNNGGAFWDIWVMFQQVLAALVVRVQT